MEEQLSTRTSPLPSVSKPCVLMVKVWEHGSPSARQCLGGAIEVYHLSPLLLTPVLMGFGDLMALQPDNALEEQ